MTIKLRAFIIIYDITYVVAENRRGKADMISIQKKRLIATRLIFIAKFSNP